MADSRSNRAAVQATNDDASASKLSVFFFFLLVKISLVSPYLLFVSRENKISTDFEFGMSKRSCVKKGYMKDDYIHLFVRRPLRRSPIINRGMLQLSFSASLNSIYVSIYIYI